ncbi:hypothetical protein QDR37_11935 [Amnibacterium sp. CER49]|uniref:hypothetical protein n=1 Tax=Amnibacterium sp. CER49 TaxID=3039161 RepID=UPI002446D05E|nr:hypothetical protein [Amnibacterium sp. CER49]MDH2444655.1 hypothetical protein [Amnibacterium sp. CER49]
MRRRLLLALIPVLVLSACTPAAPAPSATATSAAVVPAPAPSVSPVAVATPASSASIGPTPPDAHAGCAPTAARIPAGAVTATTTDVDGDGRPDVEWAVVVAGAVEFGVRTASGATASASYSFAGPAERTVAIARLGNGAVVALPSDHRGAQLFAFAHCRFVHPVGVDGKPYAFDQQDLRGNGTGVGCRGGRLLGFQVTGRSGDRTVTGTLVTVSPDGRSATNGATETIATHMGDDADVVRVASQATCSPAPLLHPRPQG